MNKLMTPAQGAINLTEEEGFEPPVPYGTTVFKTVALNHSATPPKNRIITPAPKKQINRDAKPGPYILVVARHFWQRHQNPLFLSSFTISL